MINIITGQPKPQSDIYDWARVPSHALLRSLVPDEPNRIRFAQYILTFESGNIFSLASNNFHLRKDHYEVKELKPEHISIEMKIQCGVSSIKSYGEMVYGHAYMINNRVLLSSQHYLLNILEVQNSRFMLTTCNDVQSIYRGNRTWRFKPVRVDIKVD